MKKLTIVTFLKNSEKWFGETIISILSQKKIDFVFLIIDGSDDPKIALNNQKIIDQYKKINQNCEIIYKNIIDNHPAEAILNGIKLTKTKYITFSAANDIYIKKNWFDTAVNILEKNKNLSLVFGNVLQMDEDSNFTYQAWPDLNRNPPPENEFEFHLFCIATNFMIFEVNYVVSTSLMKKLWGNSDYYNQNKIDTIWKEHPSFRFAFDFHKERYLAKFYPYIVSAARDHPRTSRNKSQQDKNNFFQTLYLNDFKKLRNETILNKELIFKDFNHKTIKKKINDKNNKISFYRKNHRVHFDHVKFNFFYKILKKYKELFNKL